MRFYTLPPVPYEYIVINANNHEIGVRYVRRHKKMIKSVIVDSGIEIFRDPNIFDYPKNHIYRIIRLHNKLRWLIPHAEVFATVPDYCDDYHPQSLWRSNEETNIERTVENVATYIDKFDYVNWLIPVQGWNNQPESLKRSVKLLDELGVVKGFQYFAVGNLCVRFNTKIIHETAKNARNLLPDKRLHLFGLKLKAIPYMAPFIDSFDSLAWTRPVNSKLKEKFGNWSCKTSEERFHFFMAWLNRLNDYLAQKTILEMEALNV